MKKQGTGIRDQGSGNVERLLRRVMPPVGERADFSEDLWPAMQRRMNAEKATLPVKLRVPWFDWVLAGGLAVSLALFPAWIPVLLYYL